MSSAERPLEAVMIGAGDRGYAAYGGCALRRPDLLRFVAVAEPDEGRRRRFAEAHGVAPARQFASHEELFAAGRLAPALFNCSIDRAHEATTLPALELGYHVMLEKPMSNTEAGCLRITEAAKAAGRVLLVGHVLRYTDFFAAVHRLVASGRLGRVVSVEHRENVAYWHMAHSFVRGNWRDSALEAPMILAKCCHDLDLLQWNLGPVARLSSFGSLVHFREDQAPAGAARRCLDPNKGACPVADDCPFYAPRVYLGDNTGWPVSVICADPDLDARRHALETGPYGRCVYRCDNDVVDHQTVSMELESGATAVLFMCGHSFREGRTMRYEGTRATLRGSFSMELGNSLEVHDHVTGEVEQISPERAERAGENSDGHGGGDSGIFAAFVDAVRGGEGGSTGADASLESHLLAFAAEASRLDGSVVQMADYRQKAWGSLRSPG